MKCNRCGNKIKKGEEYHVTKRGAHHRGCVLEVGAIREVDCKAGLNTLMRAIQYVLAHRYGEEDPVGTRVQAIEDLRHAFYFATKPKE